MDTIHNKSKKVDFATKDRISNLPKDLMDNIMDRMLIQDAVKMSILSRSWRLNWTTRTQLIFNEEFFGYLRTKFRKEFVLLNYTRIINREFRHLEGPILNFFLYIPGDSYGEMDTKDISQWILLLSANGIKEFTLENMHGRPHKLPTHIFSCLVLTHLKLHNCCFHPPPAFRGFPNLIDLEFHIVIFETNAFGNFLSSCPLLERLILDNWIFRGNLRSIHIAKLQNLKMLSLLLRELEGPITCTNIIQIMGSLQKLKELYLDFFLFKFSAEAGISNTVPATFRCLKILKLFEVDFDSSSEVFCALRLMRCSPNLQGLEIKVCGRHSYNNVVSDSDIVSELALSSWKEDCSMGRLQIVKFCFIKGLKNELSLMKFLLACSPSLEKMIVEHARLNDAECIEISNELMKFHRASPKAEIDFTSQFCSFRLCGL